MPSSGSFPSVPWDPTKVSESLPTGHTLGNVYVDGETGKLYALWQIDPALVGDQFTNGQIAYLKASLVVTNDISDAIDGADDPIVAGVAMGTLAESTSGGTTRYGLFLIHGRHTALKTNGDDDIAAGDILVIDTANDGGCNSLDPDAETTDPGRWGRGGVGIALAADVDAADTVDAMISAGLFTH